MAEELVWTAPDSEIGGVQIKEGIVTLIAKAEVNGVPLEEIVLLAARCIEDCGGIARLDWDGTPIVHAEDVLRELLPTSR